MKWIHLGDMIAAPFFALLCFYFYQIEEKTTFEKILFGFSIGGLIADVYFTYHYVYKKRI